MEQTETSEHSPHPIILIAVAKRIFCIIDKVYKFGRWQFLGFSAAARMGGWLIRTGCGKHAYLAGGDFASCVETPYLSILSLVGAPFAPIR